MYEVIIEAAIIYVKAEMSTNDSSHDWNHIERVRRLARTIAIKEGLNNEAQAIVDLCAILHDIKDWKYSSKSENASDAIRLFLNNLQMDTNLIDLVCRVVTNVGFSSQLNGGAQNWSLYDRNILNIVQDADRLDAMGAMGIARCLTYGATKKQVLYDPNIKPRTNLTEEEYKSGKHTTIGHFYEKLFKLYGLLKTETGRQIGHKRHMIMVSFVENFEEEW